MYPELRDKRALVTGAGKGIGRATAKGLWEAGASVIALSRTEADLQSLQEECPGIEVVCVDLSDWDKTRAAVEAVQPVDLLVNNAGILILEPFLTTSSETFDKILHTNVKAVVNVSQICAKSMIDRKCSGSIVNVSSVASHIGVPYLAAYCTSKGALDALTRVMAVELGAQGIRVNTVNPTVVLTDMGKMVVSDQKLADYAMSRIPLGRFPDESDCVDAILFLLSDRSKMINGANLPIEGGSLVT